RLLNRITHRGKERGKAKAAIGYSLRPQGTHSLGRGESHPCCFGGLEAAASSQGISGRPNHKRNPSLTATGDFQVARAKHPPRLLQTRSGRSGILAYSAFSPR